MWLKISNMQISYIYVSCKNVIVCHSVREVTDYVNYGVFSFNTVVISQSIYFYIKKFLIVFFLSYIFFTVFVFQLSKSRFPTLLGWSFLLSIVLQDRINNVNNISLQNLCLRCSSC